MSSLTRSGPSPRNLLLGALPKEEWQSLQHRLHSVDLSLKQELMTPNKVIEAAYFLETGSVSMIADFEDGARIEVGLVGPEGMVGLPLMLGTTEAVLEAMVQISGSALRLAAGELNTALTEAPSLGPLLLRYINSFHAQVTQTAACNGRHHIEQRLARWMLMTHDRAGGESFQMTHEFLATMLGVQRPGVTLAVGILQKAGLVRHERGRMHILDRKGLEHVSCECYGIVRDHYAWIVGTR